MHQESGSWRPLAILSEGFRPRRSDELPAYQRQTELEGYDLEECRGKGVLFAGAGRLNGELAEHAVRLPVGAVRCVDFDLVRAENLQIGFEPGDLDLPKAHALIRRLDRMCVAPTYLQAVPYSIERAVEEIPGLFEGIDYVVAGMDGYDGRVFVNREAVGRGIPAIFAAVSEDARHCEVVVSRPREACYECVWPWAEELHEVNRCPPTSTIGYIHALAAAYAAYALTAMILDWYLPWNRLVAWLDRPGGGMTRLPRNPDCPACGGEETGG